MASMEWKTGCGKKLGATRERGTARPPQETAAIGPCLEAAMYSFPLARDTWL